MSSTCVCQSKFFHSEIPQGPLVVLKRSSPSTRAYQFVLCGFGTTTLSATVFGPLLAFLGLTTRARLRPSVPIRRWLKLQGDLSPHRRLPGARTGERESLCQIGRASCRERG